ncbi:hypothetical protein BDW62DRAFT_203047 [Aspergillus aurantiobrunneus]
MDGPGTSLSAPTSLDAERQLCAAVLVVSTLSVLGSGWIIASFSVVPSLRTFRHQLILGLGLSDFIMALNVLLSTSMNLSGRHIWAEEQRAFCSFNGSMNQMFVIQTDYWILLIAVCTYLILMDHAAAAWIQDYRVALWCVPWVLPTLWAALGLGLVGCWFTSDRIRLLVNLAPRWAIIATILALYTRLCIFLYQSHRSTSSDYEVSAGALPTELRQWQVLDGGAGDSSCQAAGFPASSHLKNTTRPSWRLQISRHMLIYPAVYALIRVVPTATRIYHRTTGRQAPLGLSIVDNSCIISHGFADAVVYRGFRHVLKNAADGLAINDRVWSGWMERMRWRWRWRQSGC